MATVTLSCWMSPISSFLDPENYWDLKRDSSADDSSDTIDYFLALSTWIIRSFLALWRWVLETFFEVILIPLKFIFNSNYN